MFEPQPAGLPQNGADGAAQTGAVGIQTLRGEGAAASIPFNAALVEAFAGTFLSPMYDSPAATPAFHREVWELYCKPDPLVAVAAPRGHAKSTAFTHDFALAAALFRWEPHILIVSATEELAMGHLGDISKELHDNDDLVAEFGPFNFKVDAKGEIVVRQRDGYEFRIIARGSGQKLRGLKWNGRRPGLLLCDDMEEDEQVENADRRRKFQRWVLRALLPLGRRGAKIRWHGTILHIDSMLARILKSGSWVSRLYKAHAAFDDFSNVLWPEQFDEAELRRRRQIFVDNGDPGGYSQEYLNDPLDNEDAYIRREWFLPFREDDWDSEKLIGAAADFAISKRDKANRTSLTVGGKTLDNTLCILDQRVGRWDSTEIVEELFDVNSQWHPDFFWVEAGQIWLALWPLLRQEMQRRGIWINFIERKSISDKASRGRSLQRRMRGEGVRFPTEAHWYEGMKEEILHFTGNSEATLDDQFDSAALLSLGFEDLNDVDLSTFEPEEEIEMRQNDPRLMSGRSPITGY